MVKHALIKIESLRNRNGLELHHGAHTLQSVSETVCTVKYMNVFIFSQSNKL
jgi:hypothetical protein